LRKSRRAIGVSTELSSRDLNNERKFSRPTVLPERQGSAD
jgi:hypothetical protein